MVLSFFFSSRRRHTRCSRDWSSDVCSSDLKAAWNTTMKAIKLREDKGLVAFHADWNAGFKNGTFATVTCPAWMMGYIQGQAPDASGKWNIADVPGGGGNWGGSFLTVTKQSQ